MELPDRQQSPSATKAPRPRSRDRNRRSHRGRVSPWRGQADLLDLGARQRQRHGRVEITVTSRRPAGRPDARGPGRPAAPARDRPRSSRRTTPMTNPIMWVVHRRTRIGPLHGRLRAQRDPPPLQTGKEWARSSSAGSASATSAVVVDAPAGVAGPDRDHRTSTRHRRREHLDVPAGRIETPQRG